jgi:putative FmdB family regulatory protein
MPIYEFYCATCHRIYNFLSRRVSPDARPACPDCDQPELSRRVSSFAISKGRKEPAGGDGGPDLPADFDESRLEQAMESLAGEAEGLNEDDPRQAAQLMRKLFSATGLPTGGGMEEALRRMESGEDPEKVEAEMGDMLDNPFAEAKSGGGLRALRRSLVAPSVDPTLHEM